MSERKSKEMEIETAIGSKWKLNYCTKCGQKTRIVVNDNTYHCVSCGFSGLLADLEKEKKAKKSENKREVDELALKIMRYAKRYFVRELFKSPEALAYCKERGLSEQTLRDFEFGFAPKNAYELKQLLNSNKVTNEKLCESGLYYKRDDGKLGAFFYNRLIIPIRDVDGNVIAFGGRVIDSESQPKYKNSPETPLYRKRDNLFAYDKAKNAGKDYVFLCEGYMDAIALHSIGIPNTVASLGTALTDEQCELIRDIACKVVMLYDTDKAGQTATQRAIRLLENHGVRVYVGTTAPYKDVDEFIHTAGATACKQQLSKPIDSTKWQLDRASCATEKFEIINRHFDLWHKNF